MLRTACLICKEDWLIPLLCQLPCRHYYCYPCLRNWVKDGSRLKCPYCQQKFTLFQAPLLVALGATGYVLTKVCTLLTGLATGCVMYDFLRTYLANRELDYALSARDLFQSFMLLGGLWVVEDNFLRMRRSVQVIHVGLLINWMVVSFQGPVTVGLTNCWDMLSALLLLCT